MKKILMVALACMMLLGIIPIAHADVVEVSIPSYMCGSNVGGLYFMPLVERFNEEYEGRYKVVIEEVVQDLYNDKIMQMGQQNMLPALINGSLNEAWFLDVVVAGGLFVDLKDFVDATPAIKDYYNEANYDYNTFDGKLATVPSPLVNLITMYYNGALWTPGRPIHEMSWQDVAADLGEQKIAFMTAENAWTTMLTLTSLIAAEPGGAELMYESFPNKMMDLNNPIMINAFAKLQELLQNNASSNTVGAAYADAANSFMSNNSAIIVNGPWMMGDFGPGGEDKWSEGFDPATVHGAVLPGNVGIQNPFGWGWWIPSYLPQEEIELAKAFLEFMNRPEQLESQMTILGGAIPGFAYSEEFMAKRAEDRLADEYMSAPNADTIIVPSFEGIVPASVASPEFGKLLPKLIDGSLTPEAFAAELTKKAAETALD
ncbi:MAG: extracellular solute-binding protein [Clostridia bacterium]|nr:extracellular solute-binding protein [Clostridia bacterium]